LDIPTPIRLIYHPPSSVIINLYPLPWMHRDDAIAAYLEGLPSFFILPSLQLGYLDRYVLTIAFLIDLSNLRRRSTYL